MRVYRIEVLKDTKWQGIFRDEVVMQKLLPKWNDVVSGISLEGPPKWVYQKHNSTFWWTPWGYEVFGKSLLEDVRIITQCRLLKRKIIRKKCIWFDAIQVAIGGR